MALTILRHVELQTTSGQYILIQNDHTDLPLAINTLQDWCQMESTMLLDSFQGEQEASRHIEASDNSTFGKNLALFGSPVPLRECETFHLQPASSFHL